MIDYKALMRKWMDAQVLHLNSYDRDKDEYAISEHEACANVADDEHEAFFLGLMSYWSNDMQDFGEMKCGLAIEAFGGTPVVYPDDCGELAGQPMMNNNKQMMQDQQYRVIEVEPGNEAHAARHGYTLEDKDAELDSDVTAS